MSVIALLVSDIHLSHVPPAARSAEPDWYEAQARILRQLRSLQDTFNGVPIICAGDVFDRWNSPPELINFAIKHLPILHAVPGQHDLPYHDVALIEKSAFWTLVCEGTIKYLNGIHDFNGFHVVAFPWGCPLKPNPLQAGLSVLVAHCYVWIRGRGHYCAPDDANLAQLRSIVDTYTVCVFGDNHQAFMVDGRIVNCGCLIPRKSDERFRPPFVTLLHSDGHLERIPLDCSQDQWTKTPETSNRLEHFVGSLQDLEVAPPDFRTLLQQYLEVNQIRPSVKALIWEAIDGHP